MIICVHKLQSWLEISIKHKGAAFIIFVLNPNVTFGLVITQSFAAGIFVAWGNCNFRFHVGGLVSAAVIPLSIIYSSIWVGIRVFQRINLISAIFTSAVVYFINCCLSDIRILDILKYFLHSRASWRRCKLLRKTHSDSSKFVFKRSEHLLNRTIEFHGSYLQLFWWRRPLRFH